MVQADLLDFEHLPRLVETAARAFGRLDGLVNNASSFYATPFGKVGAREWDDLIGTNLRAPFFLAQAAAGPLAAAEGAIVNIVDIHAERPLVDFSVYTIAKAGLAGLTRALAVELAPAVRVNGVSPGAILWPDGGRHFDPEERTPHHRHHAPRAHRQPGRHRRRGKIPALRRALRDRPDRGGGRRAQPAPLT